MWALHISSVAAPHHQREANPDSSPNTNHGRTQGVNCNEMLCGSTGRRQYAATLPVVLSRVVFHAVTIVDVDGVSDPLEAGWKNEHTDQLS